MQKQCENCGRMFEAKRRTAKYCSSGCRVAYHRYKDYSVKKPSWAAGEAIASIGRSMDHKRFQHEAVAELVSLQKTIGWFLPSHDTWWRCDNCKTKVHKQMPTDEDCQCGSKAAWYILPTR